MFKGLTLEKEAIMKILTKIPSCNGCSYGKECVWITSIADPYTCGVFGNWQFCKKCHGCGYLVANNRVVNCNCSNGHVRKK